MRYTKEYLKENVQLDEVWAALATAGKAALDGLMGAGKKAAEAGTNPTRNTHATFAGHVDPNQNRGQMGTDWLVSKFTRRNKKSRISGDGGNKQSTPTKADIKPSEYSNTEQRFIEKRKNFPKTK